MTTAEAEPTALRNQRSIFESFFPGGRLTALNYSDLPECAKELFEYYSARFISPKHYRPENFHAIFAIPHPDGVTTLAAWQTKFDDSTFFGLETNVYLYDTTKAGEQVGKAEIRYNLTSRNPFFIAKPFVGWNETTPEHVNKGYGTRRLLVMNALCQTFFKLPLHSAERQIQSKRQAHESTETDLWDALVLRGLAYKYSEDGLSRYVFCLDSRKFSPILQS